MLSTLIISDLHLTNVELDKVKLFENFCKEQASEVDQLFILGDLTLGLGMMYPYPVIKSLHPYLKSFQKKQKFL